MRQLNCKIKITIFIILVILCFEKTYIVIGAEDSTEIFSKEDIEIIQDLELLEDLEMLEKIEALEVEDLKAIEALEILELEESENEQKTD